MVENLAVRRKDRQISTKSRKKLTVKNFLLIVTERNSALAVKCPRFQTMTVKARPFETLLKLVTIWRSGDIFIAQSIFCSSPRDSSYLYSSFFYGFYFSFLFLVYVCHAIITWQIKFLEQKNYDENAQTPIFFYECCKTKYKSGDIADVTFKQFSFLDQSSPYFVISLFIIWLAAPVGNTKRILTSNILPEQATRARLARLGSPSLIPGEKASS